MTDITEDILRCVAYRFTRDRDNMLDSINTHRKFVDAIPKILKMQDKSKLWDKHQANLKKLGLTDKMNYQIQEAFANEFVILNECQVVTERLDAKIKEMEEKGISDIQEKNYSISPRAFLFYLKQIRGRPND